MNWLLQLNRNKTQLPTTLKRSAKNYLRHGVVNPVLIDGAPKLEQDDQLKMKRHQFRLPYCAISWRQQVLFIWGNIWYSSANISNGWVAATKLPKEIQELNKQIKNRKSNKSRQRLQPQPQQASHRL